MAFILGENERKNVMYECTLCEWNATRCIVDEASLDAADEARITRTLTQQTLLEKQEKEQEFLKLTQERALKQQMKIKEMNNRIPKKKTIEKKKTSFEVARNKANQSKGLLQSRISSP